MSRTTFYQKNYIGWPPVLISEHADPDSYHWQTSALDMKHWLILKMGADAFDVWADRLFPGDSIEQATWKEIFDLYDKKFRVYQAQDRELNECSCLPDLPDGRSRGHCLVCEADSREEIPWQWGPSNRSEFGGE